MLQQDVSDDAFAQGNTKSTASIASNLRVSKRDSGSSKYSSSDHPSMDKKPDQDSDNVKYLAYEMPRRTQGTLASIVLLALFLAAYVSLSSLNPWKPNLSAPLEQWRKLQPADSKNKIPLEAHIMSKCPDARDCLHDLILPAMQQVEDKVDFTLSFIGQLVQFSSCRNPS
jgi:hypothetical protein